MKGEISQDGMDGWRPLSGNEHWPLLSGQMTCSAGGWLGGVGLRETGRWDAYGTAAAAVSDSAEDLSAKVRVYSQDVGSKQTLPFITPIITSQGV